MAFKRKSFCVMIVSLDVKNIETFDTILKRLLVHFGRHRDITTIAINE